MAPHDAVLDALDLLGVGHLPPGGGVAHVEGVEDLVAQGGHAGRHDVEIEGEERGGDAVQQPDVVLGSDVDHRRARRGRVVDVDADLHRARRHRPPALGVGARPARPAAPRAGSVPRSTASS